MIKKAKQLRDYRGYTCVIFDQAKCTFTSYEKGIMPLYHLNKENQPSEKFVHLADKVIGKAAALLAIRLGIKAIDTMIISQDGKKLLDLYHVDYTYDKEVPFIANRLQTDQCPMEKALDGITDLEEGFQIVHRFIQNREKRGNKS